MDKNELEHRVERLEKETFGEESEDDDWCFITFMVGLILIIPLTIVSMIIDGIHFFVYTFEDLILQRKLTDKEKTTRQLNRLKDSGINADHPIFKSKFYIQDGERK